MKLDRIASIGFLALGAVVTLEATRLPYEGSSGPGPGYFPLWIGVALMLLSGALFVSTRTPDTPFTSSGRGFLKASVVAISFPLYGVAIAYLGMIVSLVLYVVFLMRAVERRPWTETAATSVLSGLGCYLVFKVWLGVLLPQGRLGLL